MPSPLPPDVAGGGVQGDGSQVVVRVEAQGRRAEKLPPGAGQQLPHGQTLCKAKSVATCLFTRLESLPCAGPSRVSNSPLSAETVDL